MQREALLSLNDYGTPKEITKLDVINLKIIRLILYEPGTSPDQPEKGVGLVSKYRYLREDGLEELKRHIKDQINTYMPALMGVNVRLSMEKHILYLAISANETLYEWSYDGKSLKNVSLGDLDG